MKISCKYPILVHSKFNLNGTKKLIMATAYYFYPFRSGLFWELNVYSAAIDIFNSGGSAHYYLEGLKFVYSPYM